MADNKKERKRPEIDFRFFPATMSGEGGYLATTFSALYVSERSTVSGSTLATPSNFFYTTISGQSNDSRVPISSPYVVTTEGPPPPPLQSGSQVNLGSGATFAFDHINPDSSLKPHTPVQVKEVMEDNRRIVMSDIRPLFYGMKGQIRGWSMESLHLLQYLLENERPEGAFDYHTGPVNTVGIPLLETFSEDAAALFSEAARITEEYRDKHGCVRHSGAYWANWASAKAKSGHYDHALHGYLVGADEDLQHWKTPVEESFGLNVIWKEWSQRVIEASLDLIREIDSTVTLEDYRKELARVPDADAVIVRYLFTFFDNRRLQQRRDSLLVKLGVEDAIRNMGVAYEWYLKSVLTDKTKTLHPTLKDHFETRTWWTNFETERVNAKNNADPIGYALGLSTTGDITNEFWKSLIILYLVRNMFSHTMEGKFADPNSDRPEQVLGRVLHTVIKTHMFSSQTFP